MRDRFTISSHGSRIRERGAVFCERFSARLTCVIRSRDSLPLRPPHATLPLSLLPSASVVRRRLSFARAPRSK